MGLQKGFKVKVVGEYYARSQAVGKEKIIKNYEFEANIPSLTAVLSVVKNKLLAPVLKKLHEDYVMYRTYHIIQITPLDEKSKIQMNKMEVAYMDRNSLVIYITDNALPVESRFYPDLFKLRVAVQEAKIDPASYLKKLELRRADLEMDLEIDKLNPGLHDRPETPEIKVSIVSTPRSSLSPAIKKDLSDSGIEKQTSERIGGLRKDMIKLGEHGETPEEETSDI